MVKYKPEEQEKNSVFFLHLFKDLNQLHIKDSIVIIPTEIWTNHTVVSQKFSL